MKSFLISLSIIGFVIYKADHVEPIINGNWDGSYRSFSKSSAMSIVFGWNNSIEMYSSDIKNSGKASGSYKISNGNKLVITCKWPGEDSTFTLYGWLNPGRNFVNGQWDFEKQSTGTFYMAKMN